MHTMRLLLGSFYAASVFAQSENWYPESWKVNFTDALPLPSDYPFGQETTTIPANYTWKEGTIPFPCEVERRRDVPITMRDGAVIYSDVYLPTTRKSKLPVVIGLTMYGKTLPTFPAPGVPLRWSSGYAIFGEGPDVALVACHGYAVVNVDTRGSMKSEGNLVWPGTPYSLAGYDIVEWAGTQSWSSGDVAIYGSAWAGIQGYYIAAAQPPHLKAIITWGGWNDFYRELVAPGGIPDPSFWGKVDLFSIGEHKVERPEFMIEKFPLMNDYWNDKACALENIKVPTYLVANDVAYVHTLGTLEAFRRISCKDKWLRIDGSNQWYDMYDPNNEREALQFLDYYLKGEENGFPLTPPVRVDITDAGGSNRRATFNEFPASQTRYEMLYLDAKSASLSHIPARKDASVAYDAQQGTANFTISFEEDTQLIGYISANLYLEANGADDIDLFIYLEKLDAYGNVLTPEAACTPDAEQACNFLNEITGTGGIPPGAEGRLRVSLRELDPKLSTPFLPIQKFENAEKLSPGEIVKAELSLNPKAYWVKAGQQLRLTVSGHNYAYNQTTINQGKHIVHTGPSYKSYIELPIVPLHH